MSEADREFLFEYWWRGSWWSTSIWAADESEAREKIKAVAHSRYKGEVMEIIPAYIPGARPWVTLRCWWKNICRARGQP